MYVIRVTIHTDKIPQERLPALFEGHAAWFGKHFDAGSFLILGPRTDIGNGGIIIAQAESRDALDKIIAEDVFYADGRADYEVSAFKPAKIAANIPDYLNR